MTFGGPGCSTLQCCVSDFSEMYSTWMVAVVIGFVMGWPLVVVVVVAGTVVVAEPTMV